MRERSAMLGTQQVLEKDKADLSAQLKAAEQQKAELLQTVAQSAADRDFCYEIIKELKGQLQAVYAEDDELDASA